MRRALKALVTVAGTALCAAALASSAFAGTYTVSACSPFGFPGVWTQVNTAPAGLVAGQLCGGPPVGPLGGGDQGGMYSEDILNSPAAIPNGAEAGWTFTAPPQTTIAAISYYRALAAYIEPDLVAGLFQADGSPLEQCMISRAFGSSRVCSMPNTQAAVTFSGLSTRSLFFGVICHVGEPGITGCSAGGAPQHNAQADLYSARVTLLQTALPTVGQPGGPLWSGGIVAGVLPVTFAASDPSGIQQDLVRSDAGPTLILGSQFCDFTMAQPCPELPSGSLSVDTTRVPDGPHTFTLAVTDAAGNSQTAVSPSVIVDNNGPPPPGAFTAAPASGGSNTINLSWTNPTRPPAPVAGAMVQLCQASCPAATPLASSGSGQVTAPAPGTYSLRLWLIDAQGRGSASNAALATVTVPASSGSGKLGGPGKVPHPGTNGPVHTEIAAAIHGKQLHISATIAAMDHGTVKVSWRSRSFGETLASGFRTVTVRAHQLRVTFTLSHRARSGAVHVVVRTGARALASALARPS